jgi:two-component system, chemotaxis family, chemotaxis protein CheY
MPAKTLLIVDDSRTVRSIVRKMLAETGLEMSEAEDGAQALDACRASLPDAVIVDWNMPVLDGIGFVRQLRALPGGQLPAVIFCTTESSADHIVTALEAGANEYIMKPFDSEIVRLKLEQAGVL